MHSLGVKRTCIFAWKQKIEFCLTGFFIIGIEDEANALQFFIYTIFCFFFWFYFETKHLTLKYVLNSDRCNKNRNGKCFFWFLFIWLSSDIFHCVMEWINWCYTFWLWHFYVYLFCLLSFVFSFYELRNIYNVEWKIDWNNKNVV